MVFLLRRSRHLSKAGRLAQAWAVSHTRRRDGRACPAHFFLPNLPVSFALLIALPDAPTGGAGWWDSPGKAPSGDCSQAAACVHL